jgi:hypothetical protein
MGGIFTPPKPDTSTIQTTESKGLTSVNTYQPKKKKKTSYQNQIFVIDLDNNK